MASPGACTRLAPFRLCQGSAGSQIAGRESRAIIIVALVSVLIPGIVEFADQVRMRGGGWVDQLKEWAQRNLGSRIIDPTSAAEAASTTGANLTEWAESVVGLASSGIGFVFNLATIGVFT